MAVAIDPVCGMTVDPHTTPHRHTYQGHTYYFCNPKCLAKFTAAPEGYVAKAREYGLDAGFVNPALHYGDEAADRGVALQTPSPPFAERLV